MPNDGDIKDEGGLRWRYEDPPGTWVVDTPNKPLEREPKDRFTAGEGAHEV